ncbi:hypothetical protein ACFL6T_02160 [Candidatus Zixiibacteriota bacterium]
MFLWTDPCIVSILLEGQVNLPARFSEHTSTPPPVPETSYGKRSPGVPLKLVQEISSIPSWQSGPINSSRKVSEARIRTVS